MEIIFKELDQSSHHGRNFKKEFQLEYLIHQEYLLTPSEFENYNFGSASQIFNSLNPEEYKYFSQQNVVPEKDTLITLPDDILDKLQPFEENIPVTSLEIINSLQSKEYYQELAQEEEDLLEIFDGLINPSNNNNKEKKNTEISSIEEEKDQNPSIDLLSINEEKKISKNKITKKLIKDAIKNIQKLKKWLMLNKN
ncbi:hypothetical protein O181_008441 [Austropuccinia psidii MF-1]|uniref:Uncharacterized protein n=1 Tax=Austropuccinia psidii MF-1 TaxID=1389203 RepID=A0A9Q3BPV5_9BASI|nr:hypothetical protein [Austropuccinia psidii MF-1]